MYHGRSGTIAVSGTPVHRPAGQVLVGDEPVLQPTDQLDIELELGILIGVGNRPGEPVPVGTAPERIFGYVLVNDWSARDIQAFEYVPLGPFLGKSFATTISPWILPLAALEHARIRPPSRDVKLLEYLTETADWGLDIAFEVRLNGHLITRPPYASMFWSPAQMLAHMTVNGASTRSGDLFASGTVSGPEPAERGSLIELAWNASNPVPLPDGSSRSWLEDGDELTITAVAPGPDGTRIGLGSATGCILPAVPDSAESRY